MLCYPRLKGETSSIEEWGLCFLVAWFIWFEPKSLNVVEIGVVAHLHMRTIRLEGQSPFVPTRVRTLEGEGISVCQRTCVAPEPNLVVHAS